MGLPKGKTNNPAGRPAGIPNKSTAALRGRIYDLIDTHWDKLEVSLQFLTAREKWAVFEKLLSYTLPKMQSVAVEEDSTEE